MLITICCKLTARVLTIFTYLLNFLFPCVMHFPWYLWIRDMNKVQVFARYQSHCILATGVYESSRLCFYIYTKYKILLQECVVNHNLNLDLPNTSITSFMATQKNFLRLGHDSWIIGQICGLQDRPFKLDSSFIAEPSMLLPMRSPSKIHAIPGAAAVHQPYRTYMFVHSNRCSNYLANIKLPHFKYSWGLQLKIRPREIM
jgi:hypothetical protein